MPPREWRLRIEDILEAIHKIQRYVSGLSFDEFCADEKVVDAVVRNLEVIGEAARHIPPAIESRHPDLPWVEMWGMRNILVHEYFGVSPRRINEIVHGERAISADTALRLSRYFGTPTAWTAKCAPASPPADPEPRNRDIPEKSRISLERRPNWPRNGGRIASEYAFSLTVDLFMD